MEMSVPGRKITKALYSCIFVAVMLLSKDSFAQFKIGWGFNIGYVLTKKSAPITPYRLVLGVSSEGRGFVKERIAVGYLVGLELFSATNDFIFSLDGPRSKILIPVMVTGNYYFETTKIVKPYLGVGVGTYFDDVGNVEGTFNTQAAIALLGGFHRRKLHISLRYNPLAKNCLESNNDQPSPHCDGPRPPMPYLVLTIGKLFISSEE